MESCEKIIQAEIHIVVYHERPQRKVDPRKPLGVPAKPYVPAFELFNRDVIIFEFQACMYE